MYQQRMILALVIVAVLGCLACGSDHDIVTTCRSNAIDGSATTSIFDLDEVNEFLTDDADLAETLGFDQARTCAQAIAAVEAVGYDRCTCE